MATTKLSGKHSTWECDRPWLDRPIDCRNGRRSIARYTFFPICLSIYITQGLSSCWSARLLFFFTLLDSLPGQCSCRRLCCSPLRVERPPCFGTPSFLPRWLQFAVAESRRPWLRQQWLDGDDHGNFGQRFVRAFAQLLLYEPNSINQNYTTNRYSRPPLAEIVSWKIICSYQ